MDKHGIDPEKINGSKAYKRAQQMYDQVIKTSLNPVSNHPKRQLYINFLTQLDMRQWCRMLKWTNVPNGLPDWLINQMLYYRGALAGFMKNGKFYLLPFAQNKGVNIYGLPNNIVPITYNGSTAGNQPLQNKAFASEFKLIINNYGDKNDDANTAILYASTPYWASGTPVPTYALNEPIIAQMADILARVNIQIINSNKKMIIKCLDPKQKDEVFNQLATAFGSDSPFVIVSGTNLETIELQPKGENAGDLWMHFTSYGNLKNTSNGLDNTGTFEKKERENATESKGDKQATSSCLDDRFSMAKLFIDQLRLIYPDDPEIAKFDVELNEKVMRDEQVGQDEIERGDDEYNEDIPV